MYNMTLNNYVLMHGEKWHRRNVPFSKSLSINILMYGVIYSRLHFGELYKVAGKKQIPKLLMKTEDIHASVKLKSTMLKRTRFARNCLKRLAIYLHIKLLAASVWEPSTV